MPGFRTHFRPFAGTSLSRKSALLQVLSVCGSWSTCFSTYNTAVWREAIVSTCSPLLDRFMIKVWAQYAVNLVGILAAYFGLSPIKLLSLVPLISAVRLVYPDLIFDTRPVCAFSPETMLFPGFSVFQGIERDHIRGRVCICCRGFCSKSDTPNRVIVKSMAIAEKFNRRCR